MLTIEETRKLSQAVAAKLKEQFDRHGISYKLGAKLIGVPTEALSRWSKGDYNIPCDSFLIAYDLLKKLVVLPDMAFGKFDRGVSGFDNAYKTILYYFRPELAAIEEAVAQALPVEVVQGYDGTIANDQEDNSVA